MDKARGDSGPDAEKVIIIGGGVGPLAGVELHRRIIQHTQTDGTDQDHLDVYHIARASAIVDRTDQLLGRGEGDAAKGMVRSIKIAMAGAQMENRACVCGIPCNTFHAPPIFDRFLNLLARDPLKVPVVHMIGETAGFIARTYPDVLTVGLMSTTGTRQARVYHDVLEAKGLRVVEVPTEMQAELHDCIYNRQWGIKATDAVRPEVCDRFEAYRDLLAAQGAGAIILGCTEISLVYGEGEYRGIPLIDPLTLLARALIREANARKLKPCD